jgi:hypothetical protein
MDVTKLSNSEFRDLIIKVLQIKCEEGSLEAKLQWDIINAYRKFDKEQK